VLAFACSLSFALLLRRIFSLLSIGVVSPEFVYIVFSFY